MKSFFSILVLLLSLSTAAQYKGIEIEEVDNGGAVKGKTIRVYVILENDSDAVFSIYGEGSHLLEIKSTKPFFQAAQGSDLAKNISRKLAKENTQVRFDSWFTIGAEDNYDNNTEAFNFPTKDFEATGAAVKTNDGAWFCLPGSKASYARTNKKVLIMQLTSEGTMSGTFSLMGRTAKGENFFQHDITFTYPAKK
ncbi:MAG: hypothetical protein ACOYLH_06390 [Flavobacteriales bacterium]